MATVEVSYINESGNTGLAVIEEPDRVDHVWWSSRRNALGRYEKTEVTVLGALLSKLKNCKNIKVKINEDR